MRKRTSKVVSKGLPHPQHPPITTDLPEPEAFFFDPSSSGGTEPVQASTESSNNHRNLHQVIKAKATRAKQLLKGCWKDQKGAVEGCILGRDAGDQVEHERFKSMSPKQALKFRQSYRNNEIPPYGSATGPQYIPDIEDGEQRTMSPQQVYIHDDESFNKPEFTETPLLKKNQDNVRTIMDCPSLESMDDRAESPVAKLFERRTFSDSGLQSNARDEKILQHKQRHSCPEAAGTHEKKRAPNTVEKDIQKQVDDQIRLQFESKSEQIGRVKRLRESYLQKLEETKRLSQEQQEQREIAHVNMENIGEHITATDSGRKLLAERIEEEEEKEPFDEAQQDSLQSSSPANENKENLVMSGRGRLSAPVLRSTNAAKTEDQPSRMSEPIPRNKQDYSSQDGTLPILLKIAGWEKVTRNSKLGTNEEPDDRDLPDLVQLAGWKQAANRRKSEPATQRSPSDVFNEQSRRLDTQKENRAIKKAAAMYSINSTGDDDDARIPLPFGLQRVEPEEPKETPVVKKMSRMLLATHSVVAAFGDAEKNKQNGMIIPLQDLSESMDSVATPSSESTEPMVTQDALVNAAFLFSPSYVENQPSLLRLGRTESRRATSTTISTVDSRNRLLPSYFAANMTTNMSDSVPQLSSSSSSSISRSCILSSSISKSCILSTTSSQEQDSKPGEKSSNPLGIAALRRSSLASGSTENSSRRVRFSIGNQVVVSSVQKKTNKTVFAQPAKSPLKNDNLVVPPIEHKLSDLTDTFSHAGRESVTTQESNHTAPKAKEALEEVPAETDDEGSLVFSNLKHEREPSPPTNWSYNVDFDNGVTPLRSGKTGGNTTNSPYKRFNEAKNRFAAKKESPVKRNSPVKPRPRKLRQSGGLVHARVAAMEQYAQKVPSPLPKTRRDTIGHKAIAPRHANLKSAHFRPRTSFENVAGDKAIKKLSPDQAQEGSKKTSLAKAVLFKPPIRERTVSHDDSGYNADTARSNDVSSQSDSESEVDAFHFIRKNSTLDEHDRDDANDIVRDMMTAENSASIASRTSASTEYDGDEDDFAAILQFQTSIDEEDSVEIETVSTIKRTRSSLGSTMSGETAPTLAHRSSVGGNSVVTGSTAPTVVRRSSVISGGTAPTVVRHEHSDVAQDVNSAWRSSSYPYGNRLPFRQEALVRPTEQNHRAAPGTLVLSPMQRTPMQAMKWRALAAAAQEKDRRYPSYNAVNAKKSGPRRSLAERNPNVIGN